MYSILFYLIETNKISTLGVDPNLHPEDQDKLEVPDGKPNTFISDSK